MNKKIGKIYTNSSTVLKEIAPSVINVGTKFLKSSSPNKRYGISNREVLGLCVVQELRKFLDHEKHWFFSTDKNFSDDGTVGYLNNSLDKIMYCEIIEQLYLPGEYLIRTEDDANNFLINNISKSKDKDKGTAYAKDTTLFILNDTDLIDPFLWIDFVKTFFEKFKFLHVYFLGLKKHTNKSNKYYLLSFSNQKHRQCLNGEFEFTLIEDGITKFTCIQDLTKVLEKNDK